ncbi:TPA: hypothetical protein SMI16_003842 [Serratia liquefaciens]|uniref:hypothetical protein n=1 Tax=Serratia liquefaciens TaxID=614 RepID=UPI00101E917C|nr:hypothetical protein [Serratia liquefaciens]RYM69596.1 hypothetical protein BSQ99_17585 [Serratia liquefaciens]HEJ7998388.1 hypothetical protein [Serratia liquefaciens]
MKRLINFIGKWLLIATVFLGIKQALIFAGLHPAEPSLSELMKPKPAPVVFTIQDYRRSQP